MAAIAFCRLGTALFVYFVVGNNGLGGYGYQDSQSKALR
jgi:hypothetical protein